MLQTHKLVIVIFLGLGPEDLEYFFISGPLEVEKFSADPLKCPHSLMTGIKIPQKQGFFSFADS